MQIYRIENNLSNSFKSGKVTSKSLKTYANFRELFYSDIDKFLNNKMAIEEYLKAFNQNVNKIKLNENILSRLTFDEKLFISDVKTSIDLADSIKSVSSKELNDRMRELLKNKNN